MEVHIELDIECRGQCERSADEVYVTAGLARAGGTGHTRCVWAGPLSWAPPAVHRSGPIDVWRAGLEPGENALLLLNLNEQD